VGYEIMAADMALTSSGASIGSMSNSDFVLVMYVMSVCMLGGLITATLFAKRIQKGTISLKDKDPKWGALGNSTFMLTIVAVFLVPMILGGGVTLLTFLTSLVTAVILGILVRKFKILWLTNFILAISLLVAMTSSVIWTNILG